VGGAPTLPKATVQLQPPTAPIGTSSPAQTPTLFVEEDEDDEPHGGVVKVLAGVGFAAALLVLVLQLMLASHWISAEDNPKSGDWSQLIE
jgi:hypothetical protein